MSFKEFWSWNEFEGFVIFSNIRVKDEVNFFIRELLEIFYFPSSFIVELESFKGDFWKVSALSNYQSLGIKSMISLFILLWLAVGTSSFLSNVVEMIRLYCKNVQRSLSDYGKLVWNFPLWYSIYMYRLSELKSSLLLWFKNMHWTRISSIDVAVRKLLLVKCSQALKEHSQVWDNFWQMKAL